MVNDLSYRRRAQVLKALGHPSRLAMVQVLLHGEKCVCELQKLVGSDMSTVSKHLSVLRNASLVEHRKNGLKVYYRLRMPCVARFFDCVDEVLQRSGETNGATEIP